MPYKIRVKKVKKNFQKMWYSFILYLGREVVLEMRFDYVRVKNFKGASE